MTIVCGSSHAFVIDEEGSVWGFGETKSGKLGTPVSTSIFTKVELPPIERAAAGCHHSVFLDESGILWVCGENLYGQLGLEGQQIGKNGPVKNQLQHVPKLVDLSCGDYHTILLDIDKNVWAAGNNNFGQLGINHTSSATFTKIEGLNNIKSIHCAGNYSLFLDFDGVVWGCGDNRAFHFYIGNSKSNWVGTPTQLQGIPPIKEINGGNFFIFLLDFEGTVHTVGQSNYGQLGSDQDVVTITKMDCLTLPIKSCSGGWNFSVFVDIEGSVWTLGCNTHGTLGNGGTSLRVETTPQLVQNLPPIHSSACGWNYVLYLDFEGAVWLCGNAVTRQTNGNREKLAIPKPARVLFAGTKVKSARKL